MHKAKMIPLESVLKDVYMLIRNNDIEDDVVMEFGVRALEYLAAYHSYDHAICILKVENNSASFPRGMLGIELALYRKNLTHFDVKHVITDTENIVATPQSEFVSGSISYKITDFEQVNYFLNNQWEYLNLSSYAFDRSILCNPNAQLYSGCNQWFYPDTVRERFVTSFESGYIAVAYYRYPQNEEGQYLIPDTPYIKEAIQAFIFWKIYQKMWHNSVQGAQQKFQYYEQKWKETAQSAIGDLMVMSSMDYVEASKMNTFFKGGSATKIYGNQGRERFNNNY